VGALTEVVICNMALANLGHSTPLTDPGGNSDIASVTDATVEARLCQLWYERCRNQVLEDYPWDFARKYLLLTQLSDGTGKVWADEWDYSYTYPADCHVFRRFVTGTDDRDPEPWPWVIRNDGDVKVILCDVEAADANAEYTKTMAATDVDLFPEKFSDALSWLLSWRLAQSLSVPKARRDELLQTYMFTMPSAQRSDANEREDQPDRDEAWITAREDD
jgi:hypothetical protein